MAIKDTPEFHQGANSGYRRYLWHSFADQSIENYTVEFVVPTLTHEDIRYYTLGKGGFFKRTGYALSRTVITRSDAGTSTFNYSEVVEAVWQQASLICTIRLQNVPLETPRRNGALMLA